MGERVLITGIGGFAGRHLAERLRRDAGVELLGLGMSRAMPVACRRYMSCDLTDAAWVESVVGQLKPDVVYHLAACVGGATPERMWGVNVDGFTNLCNALRDSARRRGAPLRLLTIGSAAELGTLGTMRLPVGEDARCDPETDYGRAKLEVTRRALGEPTDGLLQISVARVFNLVGPGLGTHLSLGRFAADIAGFVRGLNDGVRCGNLTARRDFVDVRDAAELFVGIARHGLPGELYNVCSGRSHAIGDLLETLVAASRIDVPVACEELAPRPGDVPDVYGDPTKTERATGLRAEIPIARSLRDLLESHMPRVAA